MGNPVISVIIPCYNQGQYIDDAVDSVLAQTFQDFQIIIVNDGSTDEFTNEKLRYYNKAKTSVVRTENKGLSAARNTGFLRANSEFIQFLDADDIISPSKFEEQLSVFKQNHETEVCYTNYKNYQIDKGDFISLPDKEFLGENPLLDFLFRWERGLCIPIHCALFKKRIWSSEMPFNEELKAKEDWYMWCSLGARNIRFYYLDKEYAIYRFHENNMTRNIVEMNYAFLLAACSILQIIPENLKDEFLKQTIIHINRTLEINIYPNLVNENIDLRNRFQEMDKTIDYKIGHKLLKPYRLFKTVFFGRKYL
jgi:O-antigen biosynthesis protein